MSGQLHNRQPRGSEETSDSRAVRAIEERALLLEKAAAASGVLGYLERPMAPPVRGRPNELFLRNTLLSVFHSNRRAQEDEMWEQRQHQLKRIQMDQSGGRRDQEEDPAVVRRQGGHNEPTTKSRDPQAENPHQNSNESPSSSSSSGHSAGKEEGKVDEEWVMSEEELQAMLLRHRAKGRGGLGSRVDDVGPFLPTDDALVRGMEDAKQVARRMLKGPEMPSWMSKTSVHELLEMDASELSKIIKEKKKKGKKDKNKVNLKVKDKKKKDKEVDKDSKKKRRKERSRD
jgi:hypothetical protein